jgi:hypothetical protein
MLHGCFESATLYPTHMLSSWKSISLYSTKMISHNESDTSRGEINQQFYLNIMPACSQSYMDHRCALSQMGALGGHASLVSTLRPCSGSGSCEEVVQYWTKMRMMYGRTGVVKLALELAWNWQTTWGQIGGVGVSWHICQDAQCGQIHPIGPSHAKSRQVACHLPDEDTSIHSSMRLVLFYSISCLPYVQANPILSQLVYGPGFKGIIPPYPCTQKSKVLSCFSIDRLAMLPAVLNLIFVFHIDVVLLSHKCKS